MSSYGALAGYYDDLTRDVSYEEFADYYERIFGEDRGEHHMLLDLCCGTGTLSCLMAERGYEVIATDSSPDMLMRAREKSACLSCGVSPLLICQGAAELDLYGTVDAAFSSLDSMNYVPPKDLPEVMRRLHLFIRPDGLLIFDILTPEYLRGMDGTVSVDEGEGLFCLWRGTFDEAENALVYGMDIFIREGDLWRHEVEEHTEYVHETERLRDLLLNTGFTDVMLRTDGPLGNGGRIFITAKRKA
ncbi:MAG: class I SAM-dependent methyltransferase [Clostridia bacterium]|nr:class I SAM-dependent methyltransferase [Clostridia bacterium]